MPQANGSSYNNIVSALRERFPAVNVDTLTDIFNHLGLTWFSPVQKLWHRVAGQYEVNEFGNWTNLKDFLAFLNEAHRFLESQPFYNQASRDIQQAASQSATDSGRKRPPDPNPDSTSGDSEPLIDRRVTKKRKMASMDAETTESTNSAIVGANIDAMPGVASLDGPNLRRHIRVFKKRYNGYIPTYTDTWSTDHKTDWCVVPYLTTSLYLNSDERRWVSANVAQYRILEVKCRVHHLTALQEMTDASNTKQQVVSPATYLEFVHATGEQMPVVWDETHPFNSDSQYRLQIRSDLPQLDLSKQAVLTKDWAVRPPYFEKHPNFTTRCAGEEIAITYRPGAKYMTSLDPPNKQRWAYTAGSGVVDTQSLGVALTGLPQHIHHMQAGAMDAATMKKQFTWAENSVIGQIPPGNWPRYFLVRNHVFLGTDSSVTPCQHNAMFDYELTLEYIPIIENSEFYVRKRSAQGVPTVAYPNLLNIGPIRQYVTGKAPTIDTTTKTVKTWNVPNGPMISNTDTTYT